MKPREAGHLYVRSPNEIKRIKESLMSLNDINHPVLYSTMTTLAYNINKKYYGDKHYMWCTPYFGSDFESPHFTVPPSSSPLEIYNTLKKEVDGADLHNTKIDYNRRGIRKGASVMLKLGKITQQTHDEIVTITKLGSVDNHCLFKCHWIAQGK